MRRMKQEVNDIDLIVIPSENRLEDLEAILGRIGELTMNGAEIKRLTFHGENIDIYVATRETWSTLELIRTGSAEHNIKLCTRAKDMGIKLHASGSGLTGRDGEPVEVFSEQSIFKALGLPYRLPWERD